jgi:hypothetical protein
VPVPKGVDEFGEAQDDGCIALLRQLVSMVPGIWRWLSGAARDGGKGRGNGKETEL